MTDSIRTFFSFPNPVNEVAARLVAAGVAVLSALVVALGWTWLLVPIALGFIARAATGPRFSPLALLVTRVVVPRLPLAPRYVAGPPKRFAQAIGAALATMAAIVAIVDHDGDAARVIAATIVVAASLESALGYCIGCKAFTGLMRLGLVPESVCLDCARVGARRAG